MMGIMTYRVKSPTLHRCDLCHNASHTFYKVQLGENTYKFCSGAHANTAAKNYEDKLKAGKVTVVPDGPQEEETYE